jgi:hypothetical protein
MKKNFFLFILGLGWLLVGLVNGCKKDASPNPTDIGIRTSFTEEFDSVYKLSTKGWVMQNISVASWGQGRRGVDKAGVWHGFSAYSYTVTTDEFAYAGTPPSPPSNYTISCWLITPVLSVKNGDKISFYSRADTVGVNTDRLQVLMNKSGSAEVGTTATSVGDFTTTLIDINSAQATGGFPVTWIKYEYTFAGISGRMDTRVGFRYYVNSTTTARGVGIDLFKFEVN